MFDFKWPNRYIVRLPIAQRLIKFAANGLYSTDDKALAEELRTLPKVEEVNAKKEAPKKVEKKVEIIETVTSTDEVITLEKPAPKAKKKK